MYRLMLVSALAAPMFAQAADVSASGRVTARDANSSVSIGFSNQDRIVADRYYRNSGYRYHDDDRHDRDRGGARDNDHRGKDKHGQGKGGPPGLAKRGEHVPPGLAKKGGLPPGLQRHQRLPYGVVYQPLPRELERQMTPLPSPDYVRVQIGTDLAIMNKKTRVVVDFVRAFKR
jgi:hypothetical protein